MQIVCQINGNEHASRGWVDTHVICGVVQKLGPGISLNVMRVIVSPSELNVNPVLLSGGAVHNIPVFRKNKQSLTQHAEPIKEKSNKMEFEDIL